MRYKTIIPALATLLLLITSIASGPGCANIIPPQGGPRDSIAPVLVKATPGDSSRNFTGNKITFSFDEFVELQSIGENLMVSPTPRITPTVDYRLNTVTVKLRDTLESNTTYAINFGNAIKDFTEGNVLKNFTYTFSTGRYIDSLELRGNVILAETGKVDTTLIVMLHTDGADSAVVNDRPRYVARLDSKGNFLFRNLPPRDFYLYALKDDGGTRRYLDKKQLFAFANTAVQPSVTPAAVTLYAYASKDTVPKPNGSAGNNPFNRVTGRNRNTGADNRLKYQTNLSNNQQDLKSIFILSFEHPLRNFDSSKIQLFIDSAFNPAGPYRFVKDSSSKNLVLTHTWKENTLYRLVLDKDFAEDTLGRKLLKSDTLDFKTKKLTDYGALQIKFRNLDLKKNPVLLLVSNETIYKSVPLNGDTFSDPSFLPGEYELRILYDENRNGIWDPGEFFGKRKQPELVKPVERRISVKPAWQNEFEVAL